MSINQNICCNYNDKIDIRKVENNYLSVGIEGGKQDSITNLNPETCSPHKVTKQTELVEKARHRLQAARDVLSHINDLCSSNTDIRHRTM